MPLPQEWPLHQTFGGPSFKLIYVPVWLVGFCFCSLFCFLLLFSFLYLSLFLIFQVTFFPGFSFHTAQVYPCIHFYLDICGWKTSRGWACVKQRSYFALTNTLLGVGPAQNSRFQTIFLRTWTDKLLLQDLYFCCCLAKNFLPEAACPPSHPLRSVLISYFWGRLCLDTLSTLPAPSPANISELLYLLPFFSLKLLTPCNIQYIPLIHLWSVGCQSPPTPM